MFVRYSMFSVISKRRLCGGDAMFVVRITYWNKWISPSPWDWKCACVRVLVRVWQPMKTKNPENKQPIKIRSLRFGSKWVSEIWKVEIISRRVYLCVPVDGDVHTYIGKTYCQSTFQARTTRKRLELFEEEVSLDSCLN